ncbi:MAG: PhoH family protein [Ottowia sp.]|nr:PhoH family protein [Ottowia sp.]
MILTHAFAPVNNRRLANLCGPTGAHLRSIENHLDVSITRRAEKFRIEGSKPRAERALAVLQGLYEIAARPVPAETVHLMLAGDADAPPEADDGGIVLKTRRTHLRARTPNQGIYLNHIAEHDITFGIGPAGTGKTYLAVASAVDALERDAVQRLILTRPAVEAGERLGFLPGDLAQKVDPYLRPLYDALYDLMGFDRVNRAFERAELEIAPLAFMRGRTLNNAFVILDEAQNTTPEQMKMFLTRLGFASRCVVTGDTSQIDLPKGATSGLVDAARVLRNVKGIAFAHFDSSDVVRHPLVARIIDAYGAQERREKQQLP